MTLPPYPGSEDPDRDPTPDDPTTPPPPPPYGQQPYGQPQHQPYGPYGAWQGGNDAARGWNGTSIAALVLSLTCCLGIPAIVCGVIGLRQTRRDGSKGAWMAITGIVVGALGTLALVGLIATGAWFANQVVTPDSAEPGVCVNTDEDGDEVALLKQDCTGDHDAQIYAVHTITAAEAGTSPDPVATCTRELGADATRAMDDGLTVYSVTEDDSPEQGDRIVCLLENVDGEKLSEKLDY